MFKYTSLLFLFSLLVIVPNFLEAQNASPRAFGKNRIQYKPFDWFYLSTPNYDIYYYKDGYENARIASEIAEEDFDRITDLIGYSPYTKTKIFLYNSTSDLQQSNIGITDQNYTVGGQTTFFKSQIEIAYPGTISAFKKELSYYIARMLITDMMFGGNLKDMVQNAFLLNLPDWFMDGAAQYVSQGWSLEMDDVIRDKFKNGKIKRLNTLKNRDAALVGQSIWNFIAEKYGRSNISNILNLTRIIRNEESSISSTLGISFNKFLNEWKSYYSSMNDPISEIYATPDAKYRLRNKNKKGLAYNKVKISPSGEYVAYSENYKGKYKVIIKKTSSRKKQVALEGGHKVINQKIDPNIPLISWKDDRYLGIINVKNGKNYFWLYDINKGKKSRKEIKGFSEILDFDFSDDGSSIVLSADQNGQSDLFLMNTSTNAIRQITRDTYDDINPMFIPGSDAIVFASNRISDTITNVKVKADKMDDNFNIFIYTPDSTKRVLKRVSNTISKDIKPIPISENEILYLSDQKGIYNVYKYKIDQNVFIQITNNMPSIQNYDVNSSKELITYTAYYKGSEHLFLIPGFNSSQNNFTKPTHRQEILQARSLNEKRRTKQESNPVVKEVVKEEVPIKPDTTALITPKDTTRLTQNTKKEKDEIDTDDYQFESSPKKEVKTDSIRKSILRTYTKPPKNITIQGPYPYRSRFSANNVVTSLVIDPIRRYGILMETEMTDMLENHKFYGGILAFLDLKSSNFFGEYQYLRNRIDYKVRVDRKTFFMDRDEFVKQKYVLNKIELGASYPLSLTARISVNPFFAQTRFNNVDDVSISGIGAPQVNFAYTNYAGFKAEFVFDNSLISGLNTIEGTRIKVRFENYNGVNIGGKVAKKGFNNINIDIRNYLKLHKEIVLATRVTYGQFFGAERQNYILGGMDNWLFSKAPTNAPLEISTTKDNRNILFSEFVTPLRGFDFNKSHGSQVLLANAELRFPVVSYFYKGPISSNFFRNLQLIGFFDIGTAWDGAPPFSNDNTINTNTVSVNPFVIKVKSFQNPWLSDYGVGLRTMLLGYFAKFDLGRGVENFVTKKPKLLITIGYDF